jgi:hypothetical protein
MMRLVIHLLCFKGVYLNLDQFDLSAPERFAANTPSCSASLDSLEVSCNKFANANFMKLPLVAAFVETEHVDTQLLQGARAIGPGLFARPARDGIQSRGQAALHESLQGLRVPGWLRIV